MDQKKQWSDAWQQALENAGATLRCGAGLVAGFMGRIVGLTASGLVVSLVFSLLLVPELHAVAASEKLTATDRVGVFGLIVFVVGFPVLYAVGAKVHAGRVVVAQMIRLNGPLVTVRAADLTVSAIAAHPELLRGVSGADALKTMFFRQTAILRWPVRLALRKIVDRLPLLQITGELIGRDNGVAVDSPEVRQALATRLDELIAKKFPPPSLLDIGGILALQLLFFGLLKWTM